MEQVPQIVRERLGRARPDSHPDADVLAAFSEKTLTKREHAQVLAHLADCADCREIVALSLPEASELTAAAPKSHRFRAHWMRWATVAASVVVVSAVLVVRYGREDSRFYPFYTAKVAPPPPAQETQNLPAEQKVAELDTRSAEKQSSDNLSRQYEASASRPEAKPDASNFRKESAENNKGLLAGLKNEPARDLSQPAISSVTAAAPPPAPLSKTEATYGLRDADKKQTLADNAVQVEASGQIATADPNAPLGEATAELARAKAKDEEEARLKLRAQSAAGAGGASQPKFAINSMQNENYQSGFRPSVDSWMVSDGKLMRSTDSGNTWKAVEVARNVVFVAVCAWDSDVWAGGASGALYYSPDSGQNWRPVKPSYQGQALASDITAITFKDEKRGFLTTADNQIWTTADGGTNWQALRAAKVSTTENNKQ